MPTAAIDMFAFLRNYYQGVESKSFFSSPQADVDIYGSAWLFARWAADQYATDEAAFFRSLMQQTTASGLSNLAARTGRSISELQTNFLLALYADDFPGATYPAGARYTIPSWNTRDVWAGLNTDIASYFTSAFPLPVRAFGFGNFATPMANLLGGAAMFVEVSGTQSMPQLIEVTGGNGVAITDGSPVRLAILRVQ